MSKKKEELAQELPPVAEQKVIGSGPTEVHAKRFRHSEPVTETEVPEVAVNAKGEEI